MNFKIQIDGSPEARAYLAALNARLKDMRPLIQRVSVMELASAQGRIEAGGPGWPPTLENSKGTPLNRNGTLLRSLTRGGAGNIWEEIQGGLEVGTNLQSNGWNIGAMMQGGTGVYGRGTPIKPLHGKVLAFNVNGRMFFARQVQGSPPRRFLYVDDNDAQRATAMAIEYVKGQETT